MTRRGPRGAEKWGVETEKTAGSSVGVGGGRPSQALSHYHAPVSLCQVLTVTQAASAVAN